MVAWLLEIRMIYFCGKIGFVRVSCFVSGVWLGDLKLEILGLGSGYGLNHVKQLIFPFFIKDEKKILMPYSFTFMPRLFFFTKIFPAPFT